MKAIKSKTAEMMIGILILGFWIFMFMLGVKNQFNIPTVESKHYYTFIEEKQPIIIDLRESIELQKRPLDYDKTIHLPFLFLESRLNQVNIPQIRPLLLVCSDGNRARLIATLLNKKGVHSYFLRSGLQDTRRQDTKNKIQD